MGAAAVPAAGDVQRAHAHLQPRCQAAAGRSRRHGRQGTGARGRRGAPATSDAPAHVADVVAAPAPRPTPELQAAHVDAGAVVAGAAVGVVGSGGCSAAAPLLAKLPAAHVACLPLLPAPVPPLLAGLQLHRKRFSTPGANSRRRPGASSTEGCSDHAQGSKCVSSGGGVGTAAPEAGCRHYQRWQRRRSPGGPPRLEGPAPAARCPSDPAARRPCARCRRHWQPWCRRACPLVRPPCRPVRPGCRTGRMLLLHRGLPLLQPPLAGRRMLQNSTDHQFGRQQGCLRLAASQRRLDITRCAQHLDGGSRLSNLLRPSHACIMNWTEGEPA